MNKIAYILDEVKHRGTREGRLKTLVKLAGAGKATTTVSGPAAVSPLASTQPGGLTPKTQAGKPSTPTQPGGSPTYQQGARTNVYQGSDPNIARRAAGVAQSQQAQFQADAARRNQEQQETFRQEYAQNPEWYGTSHVQNGQYQSPAMNTMQGEYNQLLNQQATQAPPVTGAQARINTPQQARQYAQEFASTYGNIEQAIQQVPAAYQGMSPERLRSIGQDQWAAVVAGYNAHQQQAAQKPPPVATPPGTPPVATPPEPPPVPGTPPIISSTDPASETWNPPDGLSSEGQGIPPPTPDPIPETPVGTAGGDPGPQGHDSSPPVTMYGARGPDLRDGPSERSSVFPAPSSRMSARLIRNNLGYLQHLQQIEDEESEEAARRIEEIRRGWESVNLSSPVPRRPRGTIAQSHRNPRTQW